MIEMEMLMVSDSSMEVISVVEQQPLNSIAKVFLRCIILCKPARNGNFDTSVSGHDGICNFRFPYGTLVLIFFPLLNHIDSSSGCVMGFSFSFFYSFLHLVINIAVSVKEYT